MLNTHLVRLASGYITGMRMVRTTSGRPAVAHTLIAWQASRQSIGQGGGLMFKSGSDAKPVVLAGRMASC